MVGVIVTPLVPRFHRSDVLRPLRAEGLAQPPPYRTLSIVHASSRVSTTWQAPQQQGQGLFTVSLHLPGRPPHQGSTLQDATWDMEAKPLDFLLAQPGPRLAPPEHKMWAPWQGSPALSLPWGRQSPGQRLPASPPGVTLAPSSASLLIPAFLGPRRGLKRS